MAINLDSLSPAELQALIQSAEAKMESARKSQIHDVRAKMDALLKSAGLSIDDVYPRRGGKRVKVSITLAPKYRNPTNAAQTWSGRGKRPQWFNDALKKKGVTAESMLVARAAPHFAPAAKQAAKKAARKKAAKK